MQTLRFDTAPLPIAELAPIRLESADPDEPFLLGAGARRLAGTCRLALAALRRAGAPGAELDDAAHAAVRAVITPCGVVRTARIDGVAVTERVALLGEPGFAVTQWTVDGDAELVLAAEAAPHRLAAGETLTAVAGRGGTPDIARAFRAEAANLARVLGAGLELETNDSTGAAHAWARARLLAHERAGTGAALAAGLAALVAGRPADARARLASAPPDVLPLLASRYAAWTGDLQAIAPLRQRLREVADTLARTPAAGNATAVVRLAGMTELERTALDLGDAGFAAELRRLARRMDTGTPEDDAAAVHAALRGSDPLRNAAPRATTGGPPAPHACGTGSDDVARHAWRTWAALAQGLLRAGSAGWDRLLAEFGAPVRGAWPARFGTAGDDPDATALAVLAVAHGLLGLEPDAPRHRIRIAPRVLASLDRMDAHGIPCGDGTLSLGIRAGESELEVRVAQDTGAVPLTAVLEPVVGRRVAAVWVDGRRAELDTRPHGEGVKVPVQLVLDAERSLRIEWA